jgi:glutathione reductase (NADPH)
MQLTPVALAEGMRVVGTLCGEPLAPLDYDLVPTTVFSHPNIGTVGLSESEAKSRGYTVVVYEADFRPMQQAFSPNPRRVYMKLIVDQHTDIVLGCHMIGAEAGEQIQGLAAAMQASITKSQLDQTIGIHPTMAEEWVTMRTPRVEVTT